MNEIAFMMAKLGAFLWSLMNLRGGQVKIGLLGHYR